MTKEKGLPIDSFADTQRTLPILVSGTLRHPPVAGLLDPVESRENLVDVQNITPAKSMGWRALLCRLQDAQAMTRFSGPSLPPLLRGTTWSTW